MKTFRYNDNGNATTHISYRILNFLLHFEQFDNRFKLMKIEPHFHASKVSKLELDKNKRNEE